MRPLKGREPLDPSVSALKKIDESLNKLITKLDGIENRLNEIRESIEEYVG